MTTGDTSIAIESLSLRAGAFALRQVSLSIARGEYFVLLGPTGSGKTMLIETLCGLRRPQSGRITVAGRDVTYLDPAARNIGYVPQDYALIPFKTVRENIAFGLEARRMPATEITARVDAMLALLGIRHLERRYPARLSGGERQRVALARALVTEPQMLLLDEPFSAIDESMREGLGSEILHLHRRLQTTTLHICHSIDEALRLGDRLGIIAGGQLVQVGTPAEVLARPANLFVARFLRLPNVVPGRVSRTGAGTVFHLGEVSFPIPDVPSGDASAVLPYHRLQVWPYAPAAAEDTVLLRMRVAGHTTHALHPEMRLGGPVELSVPGFFPPDEWPIGHDAYVTFPRAAVHILPGEGEHPTTGATAMGETSTKAAYL